MIENRDLAARSRGRGRWRRASWGVGLVLGPWLLGLAWFSAKVPVSAADSAPVTDAIVVVTGGSGRVRQGLELLAGKRAKKLFISGVYRGVDVEDLLRVSRQAPQDLACCIALGYQADNTLGNAQETAAWMRAEGFGSLRLVTAAYHMPRALMEFRRQMPEIEIVPHPVFSEQAADHGWPRRLRVARLIASEFSKFVIGLARNLATGGG